MSRSTIPVVSIMMCMVLSGCMEATTQPALQPQPEEARWPNLAGGVQLESPIDDAINSTWTAASFTATGPANSWLMAHQSYENATETYSFNALATITTDPLANQPTHLLVIPGLPIQKSADSSRIFHQSYAFRAPAGQGIDDFVETLAFGSSIDAYTGVVFMVISNAPWTIQFNHTRNDVSNGIQGTPSTIITGDNASTEEGTTSTNGLAELALNTDSPGWNHIHIASANGQAPAAGGIHSIQASFANGQEYQQHQVNSVADRASQYVGLFQDDAGTITAQATILDDRTETWLLAFHAPIERQLMPAQLESMYCDNRCQPTTLPAKALDSSD